MRLLIVEDNEELAELLAKGLRTAGYEADVLSTVEDARAVLSTTFYAALILDLGLPDGDGLALLREMRQRDNPIPVLVLTARGGLHDRVHGLRSGADDYLVKPFALEELIARLEAQLRRPGHLLGNSLRIANLQFDTQNRQASIDDQPQVLSARETAVLELLMRSKGRVVSKKQVEDHIFGHSGEVASNAIEVYVHRLRKQLADRGAKVARCIPSAGSATSSPRKNSVLRFQSIISRIVFLHVVAVVITSVLMSVALSWLLSYATDNIHNEAMQEQAATVGEHLSVGPDGRLALNLPSDLLGLYSQAYGRYSYAVIGERGEVLFSSLANHDALFPNDRRASAIEFLQQRLGDATVSGASVTRTVGGQTVWIQAGEDLANRDVLIDDIVADFYRNVGWITLPILLVLLITDIAIFRRALRPLRQASEIAESIGPTRTDVRLPTDEIPREVRPLVSAVNLALDRLEEGFRIQRDFTADAAHELRTPLSILRTRLDLLEDPEMRRGVAAGRRRHGAYHQPVARHRRTRRLRRRCRGEGRPAIGDRRGRGICRAAGAGAGQGRRAVGRGGTGLDQGQCRNARPRHPQPLGKRHQPHRSGNDGRIRRRRRRHHQRARPRTGHRGRRAQSDLSPLLAARPQQARQHGAGIVHRAAHRRTAFSRHHGRKSHPPRGALLAQFRTGKTLSAISE